MSQILSLVLCWFAAAPQTAAETAAWETVYDRPTVFDRLDEPVVCLLDIQHPDNLRKQLAEKPLEQFGRRILQRRMAELSGRRCLLVHFSEVEGQDLEHPHIKAILITGRSRVMSEAQDAKFYRLIRETHIPIMGFCGGMQLICEAFGAKVTPMRKLRSDEQDPNPEYHPGFVKEWGFLPVKTVRRDPLFEHLPAHLIVREAHAFHVPQPPPQFDLLASTAECKVQAVKHRERVLYGTQFHPEAYDDEHPQGRLVLQNFFRLAGLAPS